MKKDKILDELNIFKLCAKYDIPLWKCPQFLFLVMGAIIIVTMLFTYFAGGRYFEDPLLILGIVTGEALILFIIGYAVISGFDKLAEVNRMKADFVDLVTHQLRSPLTTLKWGFESFQEDIQMEGEQEKLFKSLEGNVEKMSEMVNNLLLVSRMDQEGHKFEKKKFSITELTNQILEDYLVDKNKDLEFKKEIEEVPEVISDPSQIEIVIDNFISNAIKYTPKGGMVKVELKEEKKFVLFKVEDSGIGIPKDEQDKVFAKFERASNVDQVEETGSGLGLFLTKKIIEKLGGKIGFKSEEGKGSSFWIKLPI
jgi:signal transduction histidine kinase